MSPDNDTTLEIPACPRDRERRRLPLVSMIAALAFLTLGSSGGYLAYASDHEPAASPARHAARRILPPVATLPATGAGSFTAQATAQTPEAGAAPSGDQGLAAMYGNPIPGYPGVYYADSPGAFIVDCALSQCTSFYQAGPFGTTCGSITNGSQECT
jgi:hypothetical protein